jgi:hypothetical protein
MPRLRTSAMLPSRPERLRDSRCCASTCRVGPPSQVYRTKASDAACHVAEAGDRSLSCHSTGPRSLPPLMHWVRASGGPANGPDNRHESWDPFAGDDSGRRPRAVPRSRHIHLHPSWSRGSASAYVPITELRSLSDFPGFTPEPTCPSTCSVVPSSASSSPRASSRRSCSCPLAE